MDAFIDRFLLDYDDSRYPEDFLKRYEPLECLAHNEMGETLLVKERGTGALFVAKCYLEGGPLSRSSESVLLQRLRHPGLPRFAGEYRSEGMLCVVRSFAPGEALDRRACEQPLSRGEAVAVALQLCDILEYLHGQSPPIIHRDIKPQNVILDRQGQVTLIDFGSSRLFDCDSQEDTVYFGTRNFAAPEQYGFAQTDSRTDIFALGVLLCWMLTGRVELEAGRRAIPDRRLAGVVARCTAFAPKERYQSATGVREALTGRGRRRLFLAFLCAALLLLGAALGLAKTGALPGILPGGVVFQEPLIEAAARLALGRGEAEPLSAAEPLSEAELASVTELYIFGNRAAPDEAVFRDYGARFVLNDPAVQRGDIDHLDDLLKMKNLRRVFLVYQDIRDLTPLAGLGEIDTIDLRHNPVEDLSPLAGAEALASLFLFDTRVSDLSVLHGCPRLANLDIGYTLVSSAAALDGLDALQVLAARRAPLQSLDRIETHPLLEQVYLSETSVQDLSPLLLLPRLQLVELDASMRPAAQAVADQAHFQIIYQDP